MQRIEFLLPEEVGFALSKLPGTKTEHIRRAIDEYLEKHREYNPAASTSQKGIYEKKDGIDQSSSTDES